MNEEECILLKEVIDDPLADPLEVQPGDIINYKSTSPSEASEEESDVEPEVKPEVKSIEIKPKKVKQKKLKEVVKEEELTHPCDICEKKFKNANALRIHQLYHFKPRNERKRKKYKKNNYTEVNYKCKICVYGTYRKNNFDMHMKKHEKHEQLFQTSDFEMRCELCLAPISSQKYLGRHMQLVHPKARYKCKVCYVQFKAIPTLRRHLRQFHADVADVYLKELDEMAAERRNKKKKPLMSAERRKELRNEKDRQKRAQRKESKRKEVERIKKIKIEEKKMKIKMEPVEEVMRPVKIRGRKIEEKKEINVDIKQEPEIEINERGNEFLI